MLYQVLPKFDYQFKSDEMLMLFKSLATKGKKKGFFKSLLNPYEYSFYIECDENEKILFYFNATESYKDILCNAVFVFLKDKADIFESDKILEPFEVIDTLYTYEDKNYKDKEARKLARYQNDNIFMTILGMMKKRTRLQIDYRVSKASIEGRSGLLRSPNDVELICTIRVCGKTKYQRTEVKHIADTICNLTAGDKQMRVDYRDSCKESVLSGTELMNLMQLPTLYRKEAKQIEKIYYLLPGQRTLDISEFSKGIRLGNLYHPYSKRDVHIDLDQARKHWIITGATGSGKSSCLEEIIDWILMEKAKGKKDVPGFTFLDPAETSVLGVIDKVMKLKHDGYDITELEKKIVYVDFSYEDYVFPISLLNKGIKSTEIIEFFTSLFGDQKTIQVDRMMTSAINTLLKDEEEHSIFDVQKIFLDSDFREKLIMDLDGNIYASDEISFLKGKFQTNQVDPILNRIDPFKNTAQKKLMFGMTSKHDSLKHIRKWMDEGYIVLLNIKSLNEFDRKVIAGYLAMRYYLEALNRPDHSLLHFLANDESHKTQFEIYTKIAAETRKGGLSLILLTQMLQQFDPDFLARLLDNINTIISFKQGSTAAVTLSRTIRSGTVTRDALISLPVFTGYVSTEDNGVEKSIMYTVKPPLRYTDGKLVNHHNKDEVNRNEEKNRVYARELMARDFISKKEAEEIVFASHYNKEALWQEEQVLLKNGDSMLPITENGKEEIIKWDD